MKMSLRGKVEAIFIRNPLLVTHYKLRLNMRFFATLGMTG